MRRRFASHPRRDGHAHAAGHVDDDEGVGELFRGELRGAPPPSAQRHQPRVQPHAPRELRRAAGDRPPDGLGGPRVAAPPEARPDGDDEHHQGHALPEGAAVRDAAAGGRALLAIGTLARPGF